MFATKNGKNYIADPNCDNGVLRIKDVDGRKYLINVTPDLIDWDKVLEIIFQMSSDREQLMDKFKGVQINRITCDANTISIKDGKIKINKDKSIFISSVDEMTFINDCKPLCALIEKFGFDTIVKEIRQLKETVW